jgi:SSS family solute:Na+ symporter
MPIPDLLVLLAYLVGIVVLGACFVSRTRTTEQFMAGGRSLSGWAVGLSMFGSYISSISFLANPGKAFADNWNFFVFSLATPLAAGIAVRWFVPLYRHGEDVSAYEHLERRFGPWARTYAVVCFLLTQTARMGTIVYLLALAVTPLVGWRITTIILLTGFLMTAYTALGGIKAVIWTGVVQSVILIAGPVVCVVVLLTKMPGGVGQVFEIAREHQKFGLGSFALDFARPTVWVLFAYGLVTHLGNFGIDQSYVQRYITARDDRAAGRSVWLAALLYVPVAALFFFIGTALFALFTARPDLFPAELAKEPDKVFPHFIRYHLPPGMAGLVVAAIFAASMDSNLNSMATLTLRDLYQRYFRPSAREHESMAVLYLSTLFWGALGTGVALLMTRAQHALDAWWQLAGIFSGGMLGLFLLGLIARWTTSPVAATAVTTGVLAILWMTVSTTNRWPASLAMLRNPFHELMTMVVGTLTILVVGLVLSALNPTRARALSTFDI